MCAQGDASESQQDLHGRLARAFIGGPEPTTLTEDQRVEVARILSRSGIVMQEATDEQLDRDSLHERLARALRW